MQRNKTELIKREIQEKYSSSLFLFLVYNQPKCVCFKPDFFIKRGIFGSYKSKKSKKITFSKRTIPSQMDDARIMF